MKKQINFALFGVIFVLTLVFSSILVYAAKYEKWGAGKVRRSIRSDWCSRKDIQFVDKFSEVAPDEDDLDIETIYLNAHQRRYVQFATKNIKRLYVHQKDKKSLRIIDSAEEGDKLEIWGKIARIHRWYDDDGNLVSPKDGKRSRGYIYFVEVHFIEMAED